MITVEEASAIILDHLLKPAGQEMRLADSLHKVLAEPIMADRDFPPFNRVSMDGVAISYAEWTGGRRTFSIEDTQPAGAAQKSLLDRTHALEVMTGAVVPGGCDVVVRYEDLDMRGPAATVLLDSVEPWQNIHRQGADAKKGQVLLQPGVKIAPPEIALLASVGKEKVNVYTLPKVAIVSSGDELVEIGDVPLLHQVRRSNAYAVQSALAALGCDSDRFHVTDEKALMEEKMKEIARAYPVIILSGGVSKGKYDFVPEILEKIGIHKVFHQVSQRPGKPFWFGRSAAGNIAFALPGNPVSTFLCFCRYVKPWLLRCLGQQPHEHFAVLATDFSFPPPLTHFLQVSVKNEAGCLRAYPAPGGGSGDFVNLKNVSGFLELPLDKKDFKAGEVYPYRPFRD